MILIVTTIDFRLPTHYFVFRTFASMSTLKEKIQTLSQSYLPEFIEIRHHLHAHPELSYIEFETSAYIQQQLKKMGISFEVMAKTGVIGLIEGKKPGKKVIALRGDIDALPIREANEV